MAISAATYEQVALEDGDAKWELVCGRLRAKPLMTSEHNGVARLLNAQLGARLDPRELLVDMGQTRLGTSTGSYFLPDLCIVPCELSRRFRTEWPGKLEVFAEPLPLVVEVWSPSTGEYDVETKLPEYRHRGDTEIWRIHPYEKTLTSWRRQPDGSYTETVYIEGTIALHAVPGVTVDIAELFD